MGRLLSVVAGVLVGWGGPGALGPTLAYVLVAAAAVALITVSFWIRARLRPSPDGVVEAYAPMPLALYVRACKAVWRGEMYWRELAWECARIFALSSVSVGVVAALTRLVRTFLR